MAQRIAHWKTDIDGSNPDSTKNIFHQFFYEKIDDKNVTSKIDFYIGSFFCHNGGCIPENAHCNGIDDCGDLSDELNCPGITFGQAFLRISLYL